MSTPRIDADQILRDVRANPSLVHTGDITRMSSVNHDTDPSALLPAGEDTPTEDRKEDPMEMVLRLLSEMGSKVDGLSKLVKEALDLRLSDEQGYLLARQCARRLDTIEENCSRRHADKLTHPTNGTGHG